MKDTLWLHISFSRRYIIQWDNLSSALGINHWLSDFLFEIVGSNYMNFTYLNTWQRKTRDGWYMNVSRMWHNNSMNLWIIKSRGVYVIESAKCRKLACHACKRKLRIQLSLDTRYMSARFNSFKFWNNFRTCTDLLFLWMSKVHSCYVVHFLYVCFLFPHFLSLIASLCSSLFFPTSLFVNDLVVIDEVKVGCEDKNQSFSRLHFFQRCLQFSFKDTHERSLHLQRLLDSTTFQICSSVRNSSFFMVIMMTFCIFFVWFFFT